MVTKRPIIIHFTKKAVAAATFTSKTELREKGQTIHVDRYCLSNLTSAGILVDMGIVLSGTIIWKRTVTLTTAGLYYSFRCACLIPSDALIIFRYRTPNAGDVFDVTVFAHTEEV